MSDKPTPGSAAAPEWVREFENGTEYIEHVDGVPWHQAPLPGWFHRCKAQTRGWVRGSSPLTAGYLERCACGATRLDLTSPWIEKNQTRKGRRRRRG